MNHNKRMRLFAVLSKLGLNNDDSRRTIIYGFTGGRTNSTKELSNYEADELIRHLESDEYRKGDKMRKKIISMAREMNWQYIREGKLVADMNAIDTWCVSRGKFHKELMKHNNKELAELVTQFEIMYKKHLFK